MKKKRMSKTDVNNIAKAYSFLTTLAINLAVIIIGMFFLGRFLDKIFGTSPIFLFIFLIMGMLASFRNIYVLSMAVLPKAKEPYKYKGDNDKNLYTGIDKKDEKDRGSLDEWF